MVLHIRVTRSSLGRQILEFAEETAFYGEMKLASHPR